MDGDGTLAVDGWNLTFVLEDGMTQQSLFDTGGKPEPPGYVQDICERKHGGNPESAAAFDATTTAMQREKVLKAIMAAGDAGLTVDELAAAWDTTPNAVSGRFTELKKENWIVKRGTRKTRSGKAAGVWVAV